MNNSYRRSVASAIIRIVANIVMLAAIVIAMYMASRSPSSSLGTFSLWFFAIVIPNWFCAFWLIRYFKRKYPGEEESLVDLPRLGKCLVRWRVLDDQSKPRVYLGKE